MPGLSPFIQSILYGVITKSIGSGFRVKDDWQAPPEIRNSTIKREAILLGLTTGFTTMTQSIFSGAFGKVLERNPRLKSYELLLRAGFTAIGIIMAEMTSRATAPKTSWTERTGQKPHDDDDDDDRDEFRRSAEITTPGQSLFKPSAPFGATLTSVAPVPASMASATVPVLLTSAIRQVQRMPIRVPLTFSQSVTNPVVSGRFPL